MARMAVRLLGHQNLLGTQLRILSIQLKCLCHDASRNVNDNNAIQENASDTNESRAEVFQEVKSSLRNPVPKQTPLKVSSSDSSSASSLDEIRKNLSEFRLKYAAPGRSHSFPGISFHDAEKENEDDKLSFEAIRQSLLNLKPGKPSKATESGRDLASPFSLKSFSESLNVRPEMPSRPQQTPLASIFSKGLDRQPAEESQPPSGKAELMKMYSYDELGEKLRKLRPPSDSEEDKGFSIGDLNERLRKLREIEQKEAESMASGGISFKDLRDSLVQLRMSGENANKKSSFQRLALLSKLGGQVKPDFMSLPPKDHLLEQYYHPDNMSAEEKLKLELKKVREEFRMHEGDCGSTRLQIAQLTTKIRYLTQVLHKKDKHSRRGLELMAQRRRKLLKYLRRTDWESYCFVLYKLGLKDTLAPKPKRYAHHN
eukprot:TRINITY_DN22033_c0_g1_i1.p1 TRINITY_DN22033_c0_g1~~TRINITY_DN22033_c0_g1_i1.p1  ORF type:complete len:428 (-),score=58.37 TRINITY_DN22033_c0_g1_i1:362-1645(-)